MTQVDTGWFLRHRDGIEHGPFRLADIVAAAEAGNVADDTSVRHETHTRNAWVVAPRVQPIASAMPGRGGVAAPPATVAAKPSPNANPTTSPNPTQGPTAVATRTPTQAAAQASPQASPASAPSRPQPAIRSSPSAGAPAGTGTNTAQAESTPATRPSTFKKSAAAASPTNAPASPSAATASNPAAAKSAFRLPGGQQPSALPGSTPFRSNRAADATSQGEAPSTSDTGESSDSKPIQSVRIHQQTFPVPKRFFDAALALFDFRFRYFITPWIVKILWAVAVTAALLWLMRLTYDLWIQPSVDAPGPRVDDGTPGWEFEPLAGQSLFQSRGFVYAINSGGAFLLLLCLRVVMESLVVFFRVSSDIAELKRTP